MTSPVPPPLLPTARRRSWLIKIVSILALLLFLHVPLFMTRGVLRDRQEYQAHATEEVSGIWGREQKITGPVLAVPYVYRGTVARQKMVNGQWTQVDEPTLIAATAHFLPEQLAIEATVDPEVRHRGIFDVVVYTTRLKIHGSVRADFAAAGIDAERVDWGKGRLLFGVTDLHGLRSIGALRQREGKDVPFEPSGAGAPMLPLAAEAGLAEGATELAFAFDAVLQGSGVLSMAPVGKSTNVHMRCAWASPSFTGAWLPVAREVTSEGFRAEWSVAHFSRAFPQSWTTRSGTEAEIAKKIDAAQFGVRLARGVDSYSIVGRAHKYGVLFFVLIFAVYFLFEVTSDLRVHPLQYAMVGAALCLFFLGFLALTEFWATGLAYAVAAGACTAMISLYSWSFLQSGWRTLTVTTGLGVTYGYLYFVLKSEDYALIAGTIALFAVLAAIMFFTRRINWYSLDTAPAPSRS